MKNKLIDMQQQVGMKENDKFSLRDPHLLQESYSLGVEQLRSSLHERSVVQEPNRGKQDIVLQGVNLLDSLLKLAIG
jgi:hypothetical protein